MRYFNISYSAVNELTEARGFGSLSLRTARYPNRLELTNTIVARNELEGFTIVILSITELPECDFEEYVDDGILIRG